MEDKKKDLVNFIRYLENRGLLTRDIDKFDYERVIWDYFNKHFNLF
jgi:hypothetical protein